MTISPRNLVQFQNREAVFWRFKPDSNRRFRPRTERFGPFILEIYPNLESPVFGQGRKGSALLRFGGVLAIFEPRWPPAATGIRRKPRIFYRWSSLIPMPVTVIWTPNSSRRTWFKWKIWISGCVLVRLLFGHQAVNPYRVNTACAPMAAYTWTPSRNPAARIPPCPCYLLRGLYC